MYALMRNNRNPSFVLTHDIPLLLDPFDAYHYYAATGLTDCG
jgi:hypothetical protein